MNAFVIRNVQSNKIMDVLGTVGPPGAKRIIRSMLSLSLTNFEVIIYPYHYGSHQQVL